MYKIKHIIISFNQKKPIKYKKNNIMEIEKYLTLYKKKYGIQIIAYGLNTMFFHILIRDNKNIIKRYVKTIIETLDYYYRKEFNTDINMMRWKVYEINNNKDIINAIRYVHTMQYNSNKNYANYSKYVTDDFIDTHLIISSTDKKDDIDYFLKEPSDSYIYRMRKKEKSNINNKMFKRRSRAENFLNNYLINKGVSKSDVLSSDYYKEELVDKFRNETDLSFRDIGYVLGISHTSVIRIWNKSMDANI